MAADFAAWAGPPRSIIGRCGEILRVKFKPSLRTVGREQLSKHFLMRDFVYSEISQVEGIANIPDCPDRAIEAGRHLCEQLLEPLDERFVGIVIRSAYRGGGKRKRRRKQQSVQLRIQREKPCLTYLGLPGC